ncbi:hypothetical protein KAR91_34570 [Candidatus Pacearchaeota archaeon]|nr:hypothetical protein [Candidatus Pacearchaeota archaeon]
MQCKTCGGFGRLEKDPWETCPDCKGTGEEETEEEGETSNEIHNYSSSIQ